MNKDTTELILKDMMELTELTGHRTQIQRLMDRAHNAGFEEGMAFQEANKGDK